MRVRVLRVKTLINVESERFSLQSRASIEIVKRTILRFFLRRVHAFSEILFARAVFFLCSSICK